MTAINRRLFFKTVGVSAGAMLASRLPWLQAETVAAANAPLVQAFILGAKDDRLLDSLRAAAEAQGVQLFIKTEPLADRNAVAACLEQIRNNPPDGILLLATAQASPEQIRNMTSNVGAVPIVVCDALMDPVFAVRMLATRWRMKNARLCLVGEKEQEMTVPVVGTLVREIPRKRFEELWLKLETSREMRAMAQLYARCAKHQSFEIAPVDLLAAARRYVVMQRLLAAEKCHGIAVTAPAGMAVSRLLDEGVAADCGGDVDALVSQLLALSLLQRPGEVGESAPTKLLGAENPYRAEFVLRPGVSVVAVWPEGQTVTRLWLKNGGTLALGEGEGRRLRVLGRHESELKAYGRLAGITVV